MYLVPHATLYAVFLKKCFTLWDNMTRHINLIGLTHPRFLYRLPDGYFAILRQTHKPVDVFGTACHTLRGFFEKVFYPLGQHDTPYKLNRGLIEAIK